MHTPTIVELMRRRVELLRGSSTPRESAASRGRPYRGVVPFGLPGRGGVRQILPDLYGLNRRPRRCENPRNSFGEI